ncbi:TetR/AcrR family transcriptional regulator [Actinomadura nitritigenes]|uniref:TetR/AcrR family transcriptional regulator n=1 Tax=Actinomadura nitritigenes TaxID=134602 RepID=UPI003D8B0E6A
MRRDDIVAAALAVGFESLTVAAVADRLGTRRSTLYGYVADRDELATAAIEHVFASRAWPDTAAGWRRHLAEVIDLIWRTCDEHPGLADEISSLRIAPPTLVAGTNRSLTVLLDAGFTPDDALLALDMAIELALGYHQRGRTDTGTRPDTAGAMRRRRNHLPGLTDTMDPRAADRLRELLRGDPHDWFQAKADLLLDAIAARLKAQPGR